MPLNIIGLNLFEELDPMSKLAVTLLLKIVF